MGNNIFSLMTNREGKIQMNIIIFIFIIIIVIIIVIIIPSIGIIK